MMCDKWRQWTYREIGRHIRELRKKAGFRTRNKNVAVRCLKCGLRKRYSELLERAI